MNYAKTRFYIWIFPLLSLTVYLYEERSRKETLANSHRIAASRLAFIAGGRGVSQPETTTNIPKGASVWIFSTVSFSFHMSDLIYLLNSYLFFLSPASEYPAIHTARLGHKTTRLDSGYSTRYGAQCSAKGMVYLGICKVQL
jgi:hypothetical protein